MRQPKIAARRRGMLLAIAFALTGVSTPAMAEVRLTVLEGLQENPSISTAAVGLFVANIAEDEQSIDVLLNYTPLEGGAVTVAHIHLGREFVNGGIVIHLCGSGGKPACPTPTGELSATLTAVDVVEVPAQGIAAGDLAAVILAMRSGATYANVHSMVFPGGEIRGQIK
jgi:hypothetical protein